MEHGTNRGDRAVTAAMQAVWRTTRREIARIAANRVLFWASGPAPVILFIFLWALFQGEVVSNLPVAVIDQDRSNLSRQLVRMLDASNGIEVRYPLAEPGEAEVLVREGKIYGYVVIPREMESRVLRGDQAQVLGYYNAAFLSAGSVVNREFQTAAMTLSFGVKQQRMSRYGVSAVPLDAIRVQSSALFNPQLNYSYFLLVAVLPAMLQIFMTVAAVEAVGSELRWGTAPEWVGTAGGSVWKALAGKLLPYAVLFLSTSLVMVTILFRLIEIPLRGSMATIALASLLHVVAYLLLGAMLAALTANLRMATSTAAFITGPALAYMGISFPHMGMPLFGRVWGNLLPVSHYLQVLLAQGIRGDAVALSLPALGWLALFGGVFLTITLLRLRVAWNAPTYWGRT